MSFENTRKVLKSIIETEKTQTIPDFYAFYVSQDANKLSIKHAVENLFQVKVQTVRTLVEKKPVKMTRRGAVRITKQKKAYVTLQPDNVIDIENLESL
jgi:large subunit ribosomal protein L23